MRQIVNLVKPDCYWGNILPFSITLHPSFFYIPDAEMRMCMSAC